MNNFVGQSLGNGSLAHPRITNHQHVTLAASGQNLCNFFQFVFTTNHWVNFAFHYQVIKVSTVFGQDFVSILGLGFTIFASSYHIGLFLIKFKEILSFHTPLEQKVSRVTLLFLRDTQIQINGLHLISGTEQHLSKCSVKHTFQTVCFLWRRLVIFGFNQMILFAQIIIYVSKQFVIFNAKFCQQTVKVGKLHQCCQQVFQCHILVIITGGNFAGVTNDLFNFWI